jgi:Flp pilus assembly protein TadG
MSVHSPKFGCKGAAAVEFSLTLALLWIPLLLCIFDGTYFLLVNEKVDRIAYTISDIVTQYPETPSCSKMQDVMLAAGHLMNPVAFNPNTVDEENPATGYVVVTSVHQSDANTALIKWRYTYPTSGPGVSAPTSKVQYTAGGGVTLPGGLTLNANDNVIITEVFYDFVPMFLDAFVSKTLYREVVYKPRLKPFLVGCQ